MGKTLVATAESVDSPNGSEVTRMRNGLVVLAVAALFLVVACGGAGTAGPTAAAASQAPAAASSAEASAQPSLAIAASEPPPAGGGGTAAGVCELVTAAELAGIFGVASVKMTVIPGPPDNCIVASDTGDPLAAWSLTTAQSAVIYGAFTTDPSTVQVSGIGDKAAIVQNTGLLVLKGSSLLVVSISGGSDMSEDEATAASKQVGALAAGRL